MALHHHVSAVIRRLYLVDHVVNVKFNPWRREHVINKVVFSESPIFRLFFELEPYHFVVCIHHGVHVSMETLQCVHSRHIKLDFDLVVWISTNNKVDIIPIAQKQLFEALDNVFKSCFGYSCKRLLRTWWFELSVQKLCFFHPLRS